MTSSDPASAPAGFVVVANRSAGSVAGQALAEVVAVLARMGPTVLHEIDGQDDVDRALDELGDRRLIVAGGDGTIHRVVNRLRALDRGATPVGLVPMGTGNDLARGLGLPLEPADAARRAGGAAPRPMPVLVHEGTGELITNNAHAGIGERAARHAAGLKARLGALAYPAGAVLAGVRPGASPVGVRVDDGPAHEAEALALVVALGPSAGGGHRVVPDAEPDEPVLDVVLVRAGTFPARLAVGWRVVTGRDPADRPDVDRWSGRTVEIVHPGRAEVHWDVDGEGRTWPSPARLTIEPAGWYLAH